MPPTLRAAGTLIAAEPTGRLLHYRLLPWDEPGRTNLGVVTASRGTVRVPPAEDLVLNIEHDYLRPAAVGHAVEDRDDGLYATFAALPTTTGDDLLVEARAGVRRGISVELDEPVIRAGRLLSAGLGEAGAVRASAFPSAQLIAADTGDDTPAADTGDSTDTDDTTDDGDGDNPPDQGEDTDDDTTDDTTDTDTSGADMPPTRTTSSPAAAGTTAATLTASRAGAPAGLPTRPRRNDPSFRDIVRFLATRSRGGDGRLYAALSDITPGSASVNDVMQVPQWLGELWDGRQFRQRFLPLLSHGDLTAMEIKGWKWTVKPEVAPWAGNKTDVPSNVPSTEPYTLTPTRIAGAHDIDRIFRDFGVEEFWTSYWEAMRESYLRQTDGQVREFLLDEAPYVAPGAVPAGVGKGASYIVDGALAVIDVAVPTFAVVSKDLYRDLLLTRQEDLLGYLNMALGLEEGSISSFSIVPGDADFTADTVVVGAREAATVYELPGAAPLRVDALDIAKGGVDVGAFGYIAKGVNDDGGLALVSGTAPIVEEVEEDEQPAVKRTRRVRGDAAKTTARKTAAKSAAK